MSGRQGKHPVSLGKSFKKLLPAEEPERETPEEEDVGGREGLRRG